MPLKTRKGDRRQGYTGTVSDSFIEYTGVPADRFALWEDILKDVGFARGYGPGHGRPGYEEHERQAAQAIEQLWTHLALPTGSADLLPGPAVKRTVAWRTNRAVVLPAQAKEIATARPREAGFDECRALIEHWNRKSTITRQVEAADDDARTRFDGYQK